MHVRHTLWRGNGCWANDTPKKDEVAATTTEEEAAAVKGDARCITFQDQAHLTTGGLAALGAEYTRCGGVASVEQSLLYTWVGERTAAHLRHPGAVHDRDHNAAKIILADGRAERLHACGAHVSP